MGLLHKLLPAAALAATLAVAPVAASADGARVQVEPLHANYHVTNPPPVIDGTRAMALRSESSVAFVVRTENLVTDPVTGTLKPLTLDLFTFAHPNAIDPATGLGCQYPMLGNKCGGPDPATLIGGQSICTVLAARNFDSCNPVFGFHAFHITTPVRTYPCEHGMTCFFARFTGVPNPDGSELQLYLRQVPNDTTSVKSVQTAFFPAPVRAGRAED